MKQNNYKKILVLHGGFEAGDVFALGDCALVTNPLTGKAYPATAQNSIHQSLAVANNLHCTITGKGKLKEFSFKSKGMMTTLGRKVAIAVMFGMPITGPIAWLIWRTYYLSRLPMAEKKFQVATSWIADLLFERDLTFIGTIKNKSLTKVDIPTKTKTIKDFFRDLQSSSKRDNWIIRNYSIVLISSWIRSLQLSLIWYASQIIYKTTLSRLNLCL